MLAPLLHRVRSASSFSAEKHRTLDRLLSLPMNRKIAAYLRTIPDLEAFDVATLEEAPHRLSLPKPLTSSVIPWTKAPDSAIEKEMTIPELIKLLVFLLTPTRTHVIVPKNTNVKEPIMLHENPLLISHTDITVQENSSLTVINFQDETRPSIQYLCCHLLTNARLSLWTVGLGNLFSSHVQEIRFDGDDAVAKNKTLYFGKENDRSDYFVRHIHGGRGGRSEIASIGILKDRAYARYDGMIDIRQTGSGTDASLEEKTLLLSDTARIEAVPGLEIGTNDVKAGHSAAVTRVDDEQLFYAAARGIPDHESVRLIAEGFLGKRLRALPAPELVERAAKRLKHYLDAPA